MKILLIEDDELLRESTSMFLQEEGYEVHTARNGIHGVRSAIDVEPNLILCDISMPRVNGYEVLRLLNEHPQVKNIPFIFLTAKTENADVEYGLSMGADGYLIKPFDFDKLLDTVRKWTP